MSGIVQPKLLIERSLRISPHPYEPPGGLGIVLSRMLIMLLSKPRLDLLQRSSIQDNIAMFRNHQHEMHMVVEKGLLMVLL